MGNKTTHITTVDRSHNINAESSKSGRCVTDDNIVLHNLGYKCELKVFVKIQRNRYNTGHVNRCVEVEHGKDSTDCQSIGEIDN